MKEITHIFLLLLLFLLCLAGCSHPDYPRLLAAADSLMDCRPDSAWKIVKTVPHKKLRTEKERMFYRVLDAEARMFNGICPTDSALLKAAIHYFQQTADAALLARASYSMGVLHSYKRNYDAALIAYRQAAEQARQAQNWRLLGRIYNQAGNIYQFNGLIAAADSLYRLMEQQARQAADTLLLSEAIYRQGMCKLHAGKEKFPETKARLLEAYNLSAGTQRGSITMSLSHLCSRWQDYDAALRYAKEAISLMLSDTARLYRAYVITGDAYYKLGQYDSARSYFRKSLLTDAPEIKASAYMRLADMAKKQQKWKEVSQYQEQEMRYRQLSHEQNKKNDILLLRKNTEINEAWELAQRYANWLWLCGAVSALTVARLVVLYIRKHRETNRDTNRQKQKIPGNSLLPPITKMIMARQEKPVPGWEKEDFNRFAKAICEIDIFNKMKKVIKYRKENPYNGKEDLWNASDEACLLAEVERLLPGYQDNLRAICPLLDDEEIFILCLLLTKLPVVHIALLQKKSRTRDNLYKRLQKLQKEKMNHLEGKDIKERLYSVPRIQKSR